ncbi:MAG: ATP-dependent RecD-like DNA helicase [Parachlamydiaceae bacterium]|nr:ATP-dependent RecD-like DNA helicase [Parachlamydiaceae bacterium]
MDEIVGYIERITFQNPENGFTIAQLQENKKKALTCIVGTLPSLSPGETLRCQGKWKQHLVHGMQFEVERYKTEIPASIEGIKKYLGSGLIKGIGSTYAGRIVDKFGVDTLDIIEKEPQRLLEIPGFGKKKLEKITSCWSEQKSVREVMIFLQANGVTPSYAQKIYKIYGDKSIAKVQENPYRLARDVRGIGFKTADTIAQTMGIAKDSTQRIDAGIEFVLSELAGDGHVCYPHNEFLQAAEEILAVGQIAIAEQVVALEKESRIEVMDLVQAGVVTPFLWSKMLFAAEIGIARELKRLRDAECSLRKVDVIKALDWVQKRLNIELASHQKDAVSKALESKVQIITGGPGTGKSTITNAIMAITEQLSSKIVLAAPTGRAAKRMTEITGRKAQTIHSLLEFDFSNFGFKRKRENPLECDLIIVDEASMIDTSLMWSLLKAIPDHARLILVGDIYQLPSVGPGNVLKDIIGSKSIPVSMLTEIFRQAAGSRIIVNAHKINRGDFPDIRNLSDSDFYFIDAQTPEQVLNHIVTLVSQRLPLKYKFDPLEDIQVLAPMKKGEIGTENLNRVLQKVLNPDKEGIERWGTRFQIGDKVMQLRNNYKKNVFNGDIGKIVEMDQGEQMLLISFDEQMIEYEFDELDELALAYAVSIHKYQGSERKCVVIPVHTTHFKLLHRNLLYTAVTRGKQLVVLVGMTKALYIAVKNDEVKRRYSGLQQAVSGILNPSIL